MGTVTVIRQSEVERIRCTSSSCPAPGQHLLRPANEALTGIGENVVSHTRRGPAKYPGLPPKSLQVNPAVA